tara:strand:+ start:363 stop:755 length:393 start_codon:yes stop_codon:yes gene_type:complete
MSGKPNRLIGPDAEDTESIDINCRYPAQALGGSPTRNTRIRINDQVVETYDETSTLSSVPGSPSVIGIACIDGIRRILPSTPRTNNTVKFEGKFPAVMGDSVTLYTSSGQQLRPLTGPTQYDNIIIGSRI